MWFFKQNANLIRRFREVFILISYFLVNMPGDNKKHTIIAHAQSPIIVTVAEKNALADQTNPVLSSIPMKLPQPQPISVTPPPAYSAEEAPRSLISKLKSKMRKQPRWSEDKVSAICVPVIITWLLVASFFAGLLFYRYFGRRFGEPTFYRWCGTDFIDDQLGERQRLEQKLEINEQEVISNFQLIIKLIL